MVIQSTGFWVGMSRSWEKPNFLEKCIAKE
jgi:hypothetical protein